MIGLPLYTFRGRRPSVGYKWIGDVLTDGLTSGARDELLRAIDEEDADAVEGNPALFREFAALPPTKDAFKAFADRYGALREDGDTLEMWNQAIAEMHHAVTVADAAQRNDTAYLQTIFRWEVGLDTLDPAIERYFYDEVGPSSGLSREQVDALLLSTIKATYAHVRVLGSNATLNAYRVGLASPRQAANDLRVAGYVYLIELLNAHMLPKSVEGPLSKLSFLPRGVGAHFALVDNKPGVWLQLRPETLLDALWLQFGRGLMGGYEYKACENARCHRWFEISPAGASRNRIYCGRSSCKVEAFKARNPGGKARQPKTKPRKAGSNDDGKA